MKLIKRKLIEIRNYYNASKYYKSVNYRSDKKRMFIFSTPIHRNIGDHAIVLAELEYLKDKFNDFLVVEIPRQFTNYFIKKVKTNPDDLIMITGGGFFGNIYPVEAESFLKVINKYANNPIIIFPQTMYIDKNLEHNKYSLESFRKTISKAKDITFFAREDASYQLAKESNMFTKVLLVPDIVLYLNKINGGESRNGVLFVFREDSENTRTFDVDSLRRNIQDKYSYAVSSSSTMSENAIFVDNRHSMVNSKLEEFGKAEVVITDRLHGMIFAYLTNTPCIAIDNITKKSSGVYNAWLKDIPSIKLLSGDIDLEDISKLVENLTKTSTEVRVNREMFDDLTDLISSKL